MTANQWNELPKTKRKKLLQFAGHSKNLAYRAFDFVPRNVQLDLHYAFLKSQGAQNATS